MKKITLLIKPTEECNFRCQYCYHADSAYEKGRMTMALFEEIVEKTASCYHEINLTFHGGEPLLMGYDFYEKALSVIDKYRRNGIHWRLGIQTNGYFLDEKFCDLFRVYGFSPSVSFDGPGNMNCLRDKTSEVSGKIIELREKGYSINLLGVVTKRNIDHLWDFYAFAKQYGCPCKLNPVFESGAAKTKNDYLITPEEYIVALKSLLPIWLEDDESESRFDPLSSLIYMALENRNAPICEYCGCLSRWIAIGYDGTLYPCSRSYPEDFCIGNIKNIDRLSQAFEHKNFIKLLKGAIERRDYCSKICRYYPLCQGGCNNDSILQGNLARPAGFKCQVIKALIPYIREYFQEHQNKIKNKTVLSFIEEGQ